tara:strand:+ start:1291 stop:1992 length:702 start_codon:yes stop_codon:yes gene_type:complete
MSLIDNIFNGPGYSIENIQNMEVFENLRKTFIKKMGFDNNKDTINNIRQKMAKLSKVEINKAMVNLLSFNEASEKMIQSCSNIVSELSGNEIIIQRRANTIFNVPGKDERRQWPHYELMSGISPFTFVIWAPFHDLDDDGGVYYVKQDESFNLIKKEEAQGLVNGPDILNMMNDQKPLKLKYGQVVVFNPFILHGNIEFNSSMARIACSVRFQNKNKPLMQKNSDFFKLYKIN